MYEIYSKLIIKTAEGVIEVVLVFLSLKNFTHRSCASMIDFEEVNDGLVVSSKGTGMHDSLKENL